MHLGVTVRAANQHEAPVLKIRTGRWFQEPGCGPGRGSEHENRNRAHVGKQHGDRILCHGCLSLAYVNGEGKRHLHIIASDKVKINTTPLLLLQSEAER